MTPWRGGEVAFLEILQKRLLSAEGERIRAFGGDRWLDKRGGQWINNYNATPVEGT